MIIMAFVLFMLWHVANEQREAAQREPLPPSEIPSALEPPAGESNEEDWEGLDQVWCSIRQRFDDDPNTAIVYADIVISDLLLDHNGPPSGNLGHPCNFGSPLVKSSYQAAHEITASGKSRPLSPDEMKEAMALYVTVFDRVFGRNTNGHEEHE